MSLVNLKNNFLNIIRKMPDMNGIETVRRIRKVIENEDTPIIILTAYDWTDIEEEAKEAEVTAFVSKPLFMSELRAALAHQAVEPVIQDTKEKYRYAGKKVLLVEDNELNREIASAILKEAGLKIESVEDGTDAVERMSVADESEFDLIFMDIQMPKMDIQPPVKSERQGITKKRISLSLL